MSLPWDAVLASGAALVAATPYYREALSHPSYVKLRYRFLACGGITGALALILYAIWSVR